MFKYLLIFSILFSGCSPYLPEETLVESAWLKERTIEIQKYTDLGDELENWILWVPRYLTMFDMVLEDAGLIPLNEGTDGLVVSIHEVEEDSVLAGEYVYDEFRVYLYERESKPGRPWHKTAFSHEIVHVYEDVTLHLSNTEYVTVYRSGYHFVLNEMIDNLRKKAITKTLNGDWDCTGNEELDKIPGHCE